MLKEIWNKKEVIRLAAMLLLATLIAFIPPEKSSAGNVGTMAVDSIYYYQVNTIQYWNLMQEKLKSK